MISRHALLLLAAAMLHPGALAAAEFPKIQVLGLFKGKAIVVVEGRQRVLRAGETSPEGLTLLSADSEQAVVEFSGETRHLGLGRHIGSTFRGPERRSLRLWPSRNGMYTVRGTVNGQPIDFVVDTGATFISLNRRQARRLGIDYLAVGEPGLSSTAAGVIKVYKVAFDRVKIGPIELRNVTGVVHDDDFPEYALLGMSFLGRVDMKREGVEMELSTKY